MQIIWAFELSQPAFSHSQYYVYMYSTSSSFVSWALVQCSSCLFCSDSLWNILALGMVFLIMCMLFFRLSFCPENCEGCKETLDHPYQMPCRKHYVGSCCKNSKNCPQCGVPSDVELCIDSYALCKRFVISINMHFHNYVAYNNYVPSVPICFHNPLTERTLRILGFTMPLLAILKKLCHFLSLKQLMVATMVMKKR